MKLSVLKADMNPNLLPYRVPVGVDVLKERSPSKDLGDTAKAILRNNAVVAALLLSTAIGLARGSAPQDDPTRFLSQW